MQCNAMQCRINNIIINIFVIIITRNRTQNSILREEKILIKTLKNSKFFFLKKKEKVGKEKTKKDFEKIHAHTHTHWRAQGRFHRNARCPALAWSPQLREFHNQFSSDLLEMLPLPFVITASSCARDNLRKYLPKTAVSLEIELAVVLRFDLDIKTDGTLRRIILHLPHPTAGFFTSRKNRESMAIQIDAGMNFMLWLMGKDYNPTSFTNRYSGSRPRFVHTAPLSEMWGYVRKEAVEGKTLRLEDYSPSFLSWI